MAHSVKHQSLNGTTGAAISARVRHSLLIMVVLMVVIIGAVGYDLFGRWASMQGGPEMAPCGTCQQRPSLGVVTRDFNAPTA